MNPIYEKLEKCYQCVREKTDFVPEVAIILGSGFGQFADEFEEVKKISYHEIEGFPVSTVQGHAGEFIFGYMQDVPVVLMNGRVHYYEGYAMSDVVLPTRLMKMLGAKILFLTNAAGGLGDGFAAGDIMMITDQLTMFVDSPLIGANVEELGVRFPDMSEIYDKKLQDILRQTAKEIGLDLKEGIYCQFKGPNYESPAEVRAAKILGASAVGMSTGCEAIAANHMGMQICGISCVTNMAAGMSENPLSHQEVQENAAKATPYIRRLLHESVLKMHKELNK